MIENNSYLVYSFKEGMEKLFTRGEIKLCVALRKDIIIFFQLS